MLFFQLPILAELMVSVGDYAMITAICEKIGCHEDDIEAYKYSMSRPGKYNFAHWTRFIWIGSIITTFDKQLS